MTQLCGSNLGFLGCIYKGRRTPPGLRPTSRGSANAPTREPYVCCAPVHDYAECKHADRTGEAHRAANLDTSPEAVTSATWEADTIYNF